MQKKHYIMADFQWLKDLFQEMNGDFKECQTEENVNSVFKSYKPYAIVLSIFGIILMFVHAFTREEVTITLGIIFLLLGIIIFLVLMSHSRKAIREIEEIKVNTYQDEEQSNIETNKIYNNVIQALDNDDFIEELIKISTGKEIEKQIAHFVKNEIIKREKETHSISENIPSDWNNSYIAIRVNLSNSMKNNTSLANAFKGLFEDIINSPFELIPKALCSSKITNSLAETIWGEDGVKYAADLSELFNWMETNHNHFITNMILDYNLNLGEMGYKFMTICEQNKESIKQLFDDWKAKKVVDLNQYFN